MLTLNHLDGSVIAFFPTFVNEDGWVEAEFPTNPLDVDAINCYLDAYANMEIFQAVEIALCHVNEGHMEQGPLDSENPDGVTFTYYTSED